jgi:hypothetical protein
MNMRMLPSLLAALVISGVPAPAADSVADDLVEKIMESQNTRGAVIRATLTVEDAASDRKYAAQIRIRLRRDGNVTRMLFQVMWPDAHKGEALSLERTGRGTVSGFFFEPPEKVTPVDATAMSRSYLGSDLTFEDLADEFWQWPSQKISGEESIRGELCKILDSRPPPGVKSAYSLVRSWISPEKLLPLRIEKFGRDERLAKRITVQKTSRHEGVWVPVTTLVQRSDGSRQTTLKLSRGERNIEIPIEEFLPEKVRNP